MSGGSFNYVSVRDVPDPSDPGEDHDAIVEALAEYPGAEAIVEEARAALEKWREAAAEWRKAAEAWERLSPILKAVEWHRSGDWGEECVVEAVRAHAPTSQQHDA